VPDEELYKRVEKRVRETPPEKRRSDDTVETLKNRLDVYHAQTKALVPYYEGQGKIAHIDGLMTIEEVSAAIDKALFSSGGGGGVFGWLGGLFGGRK
jgi:adenylate kinase